MQRQGATRLGAAVSRIQQSTAHRLLAQWRLSARWAKMDHKRRAYVSCLRLLRTSSGATNILCGALRRASCRLALANWQAGCQGFLAAEAPPLFPLTS
jgi:hypothetical protein